MASQAAIITSGTFDVASSRSVTIKWNDADTRQIINWLLEQDR